LWFLSRNFTFDGRQLTAALAATFERRQSALPASTPVGLTPAFATEKTVQWTVFIRRNALAPVELDSVLDAIRDFALPPLRAAAEKTSFVSQWASAEGWHQP